MRNPKADAFTDEEIALGLEPRTHQEINRIPNIHLLKKPAWSTGADPLDEVERVEYGGGDFGASLLKSLLSIPVLILLAFPILAVLSLTMFQHGTFPDSLTPHMFKGAPAPDSATSAGIWALALVSFVPWSAVVCRLENRLCEYF